MLTESIAKLSVKLEGSIERPIEELRERHWFEWLRTDETLWVIPMSKKQIETDSGYILVFAAQFMSLWPSIRSHSRHGSITGHEGLCIIAMTRGTSPHEILGYDVLDYHDEWGVHEQEEFVVKVKEVDFSRFPIQIG